MSATITTIVHSFARPRMLREALESVRDADQVVLCDDGSTFDVHALAAEVLGAVPSIVLSLEPLTIDERMASARQGALVNMAILDHATGSVITHLCDDDLHHRRWYDALHIHYAWHPTTPLVRGDWLQFWDEAGPRWDSPPADLDDRQMTCGNFAYLRTLVTARGVRWPIEQQNSLDDQFLHACHRAGVNMFTAPCIGFAGWRRDHSKVNLRYTTGKNHTHEFRHVLESGYCE